eukprot:2315929-Pleurochrysis_carterae.AAC.1
MTIGTAAYASAAPHTHLRSRSPGHFIALITLACTHSHPHLSSHRSAFPDDADAGIQARTRARTHTCTHSHRHQRAQPSPQHAATHTHAVSIATP